MAAAVLEAMGYAVAIVLTIVVVAHLAESYAWMLFTDGDSLVTVLVARSLAAGEVQDWAMSPVLFIPETVVYATLSLFGLSVRATLTLNAVVNFLALYGAIRLVAGSRQHVERPVLRSLLAFVSICLLALLDGGTARTGYQLASELAMTTHYSATVIGAVAALGLARRVSTATTRGRRVLIVALVLVSALSTLTNPLYAGWVVLPAIVVLLVLATMRLCTRRLAVMLTVALVAGTLLGVMLRVPLAPWIVADGRNYLRPDRWSASLTHYAELIAETLNTAAGAASLILMLALWVASIGIAVSAVRRRDTDAAFVALCVCLAPVIILTGAIAMGTEAARYLQPWAFMPALALTVLPLPGPMRTLSRRTAFLRVATTASTVAVLGMALASSVPRVITAATTIDADLRCVTDWIDASDRTGAGQFWTARAPKAYADDPGQVIQIDHQLNVYTWLTNRTDRIGANITYLITDANSHPFSFPDGSSEGAAIRVECGRYTILDFFPNAVPLGFSWP